MEIWATAVAAWAAVVPFPFEPEIGSVATKFAVITTSPRMFVVFGVVRVALVPPWWLIQAIRRPWTVAPTTAWGQALWPAHRAPDLLPQLGPPLDLLAVMVNILGDHRVRMPYRPVLAEALLPTRLSTPILAQPRDPTLPARSIAVLPRPPFKLLETVLLRQAHRTIVIITTTSMQDNQRTTHLRFSLLAWAVSLLAAAMLVRMAPALHQANRLLKHYSSPLLSSDPRRPSS